MKAELLLKERRIISASGVFMELAVWKLPRRLSGSTHRLKYRLALVADGVCVLRYDNEDGKGDHKHVRDREVPYRFQSLEQLQADFLHDVAEWIEHGDG